jgi:nitroimidazol reductase NimA-like FMN-containing flavoprotein (pyridoxamine 5'-phosphate oxidase superfamily)
MSSDLEQAAEYLEHMRIPLRLACTTKSGWPMVLSLWYQYQDRKLYCATKRSARVVSYLQNSQRCAFEIAADQPPYCGLRGQAVAAIDEEIGAAVLENLIQRYIGSVDNDLARNLLKDRDEEVAIVLEPIKVFSWDFSKRMNDIAPSMIALSNKLCP